MSEYVELGVCKVLGEQRACCALQERETASAEADSVAKLRLMRQDAAAKGAQLDTLLGSSRARLEAMLGWRGQGTACHHSMHICSSVQGATPTSPFRATNTGPPGVLQLNMLQPQPRAPGRRSSSAASKILCA